MGTPCLFAVRAVNSINGVSIATLPAIVAMKLRVIGRLANVLMVCVKLVSMAELAVTNANQEDTALIVKMNAEVVWMEKRVNQPMVRVQVVLLDFFRHFVLIPAPTDFSVWVAN